MEQFTVGQAQAFRDAALSEWTTDALTRLESPIRN